MNNLPRFDISEVKRVLKENGTVIFCFNELFSVPVIILLCKRLFRNEGFEELKVYPISPGNIIPGLYTNWALIAKKPETANAKKIDI
ncbi:MAG: hypothetical protein WAU07_02630 [Microgenomates group bacterium]